MSILNDIINRVNDWREKTMNEERARDFQSIIAAGKKLVAKIKKPTASSAKIIPYDNDDCYYSDEFEVNGEAEAKVEVIADETPAEAENTENSFGYYEKIMSKLEGLKGNNIATDGIKKLEELLGKTISKGEFQDELDTLMVELEDKLQAISEKAVNTNENVTLIFETVSEFTEKLSAFGENISSVENKADEISSVLTGVDALLKNNEGKIDEIHEASIGISKVVDTLFELKNANLQLNNELKDIKKKQNFIKIWGIAATSLLTVATAAILVILFVVK